MRVKWNRQLDGSLTRRQAEEEAAAAAQLCKDKPKSTTPKIFRLFRRKKHHRPSDEESDRNPDASLCSPSEADEEDCASISSVASQPVTELCQRDRTVSLFSSFRLNFPGGKKKSKRSGGMPLFQEKEPENNRFSSPDLMREKLGAAARPQAELSKSSPSVRNTNDSTASISGDFPSLGELRAETSVSFQQLKHAGIKGGPDVAKLAKSVSFSDCQATLNSKQVTCASARTLRTPNGQTEPNAKTSVKKCLSHSTEVQEKVCENESTSIGNDSLRLPSEPSFWKSAVESSQNKTHSAMSDIVSSSSRRAALSCKEAPRDKCVSNDVRGKWFNEVHCIDRNGNLFEKCAGGKEMCSVSDKTIVMLDRKSTVPCNGQVSRDKCSTEVMHVSETCDFVCGTSYTGGSDIPHTSPAPFSKEDGISCVEKLLNIHKHDESETCDTVPCLKSTSQLLKNNNLTEASVKNISDKEISENCIEHSTVEIPFVFRNGNDSTCTNIVNSVSKVLCNDDRKKHASTTAKSNCVLNDVCYSVANTHDLNMLPDNEKRLLDEMLRDFGINTFVNEQYCVPDKYLSQEVKISGNKIQPEAEVRSKNSSRLCSENKELNFGNEPDQSLLTVPFDNLAVSGKLIGLPLTSKNMDCVTASGVSQHSASSKKYNFARCVINNIIDSNDNITLSTKNTLTFIAPPNIVQLDEPSAALVKDECESAPCVQADDITLLNFPFNVALTDANIMTDKIQKPYFLSDNLVSNEDNFISNVQIGKFDQSSISFSPDEKKVLTVSKEKHIRGPLLLTYSESKSIFNDWLFDFNFENPMSENTDFFNDLYSSCFRLKKSSVLNLSNPIPHLYDLNNNTLCDTESYLQKLTEAANDSVFSFQNNSNPGNHTKGVTVWNASFVQNTIFPCEIFPSQQLCIDSSGGRGLSDHVPSSYATVCGKLRLEERCPDVANPSGSSSNSVTLHGSDLHTGGIDTTQNPEDGSEMLAKVGASLAFCEKSCNSPSVFLDVNEIKDGCAEIYDCHHYPGDSDKSVITLSNERYNSFTTNSCEDSGIMFSSEWFTTKTSSETLESAIKPNVNDEIVVNGSRCIENVSDLKSLKSETMHSGICNANSGLISNSCCSGIRLEYETDVMESNAIESNIEDQVVVVNEGDYSKTFSGLASHTSETIQQNEINDFSCSNSVIQNEYQCSNDFQSEHPKGICISSPKSEDHVLGDAFDLVSNESDINSVKDKIQFFENGSPTMSVERCKSSKTCDEKMISTRRKSLERNKISMIPSLKKVCLNVVNEKQSTILDLKKIKIVEITQPNLGNDPSVTKLETVNEFENILRTSVSSANFLNSTSGSQKNTSLESEYKHIRDSFEESEHHFGASSKFSKLCRSEELLSSPSGMSTMLKLKSGLQTRRHSSTENSSNIAYSEGKVAEKDLTTDLTSSVHQEFQKGISELSSQRSSVTLNEARGVQGQSECGLQERCASLPLVMGQVRATSPLNYARKRCPIRDASRGKSRIPRKQSGVRAALHSKPVRPPMWLSKAELTAEIQRLGTLCEARTKELNRLKMETKHVSVGFDAFASLFKYMVEDLNALSMPILSEDLKKTLKQLELAKQDLAYYEREVEEMKAHHCQELNDLSNKLFEVFHGEVTELSAKHQEEMNRLNSDHQKQIETLSATFDTTSQEAFSKHEAAVAKLQQELISQREELQLLHEREIADLEEKHTQSTKTLQEHIEQLQKKCAELKQHSLGMEDAMRKDTDTKLQWVTSRKVDLEKEVESLKAVLEMKNKELHTLRVQTLEMEKQLEELPLAREKIKMLQARAEDLEALMAEKTKLERRLSTENQQIRDTYERESKVNKRLSMENEELLWRIRQTEQSLLSDSFSVAEYPEDVENGSISPTKSPPSHMSRSVFFTYVDKDDQTSSPRSTYKKITPGFAAGYKTSPYKSPPAPSPRRSKSNSDPPQPLSHNSSTPRKGPKQSSLKQKRQRSGSDCGKVSGDPPDVTFLSVAGSMTSSVSSESSVFGERLLEEHKEQILESLEILREQRSSESDRCQEGGNSKEDESTANLESEDMSRSSEFSDPKTYYHMAFPVLKEAGMPDCDIGVTAQATHSTSDSTSPVNDRLEMQQIVPSQENDVSVGDCEEESANTSSVRVTRSFENICESECEKQSKEDRWRTI